MVFFDFLSSKPKAEISSQPASTNDMPQDNKGPLKFDPDLIPQLVQEHRALLRLFGEVKQSHISNDFMALKRALQKFQLTVHLHLASENANFYAYLRNNLSKNTEEHKTVAVCSDEMQEIGNVVSQFLRKYNHSDFTSEMQSSFGHELEAIGTALANRIEHEEKNLYSLYVPA